MVNIAGRPRQESLDRAILDAAVRLLVEHGYGGVRIDAVATAAGTTRAAVYRRHGSVAALVTAAYAREFGVDPGVDTGSLAADLRAIQEHRLALFNHPLITRGLPGLIDDLSRQSELADAFWSDFLGPRRAAATEAVRRAVARGEIEPGVDKEWISDLLTGPLLMRAVLPGLEPIDDALVRRTVAAALREVGLRD
ncbi:TetR-like C-terminal domain-containing protein [Tomitella biformata]|uniref:TetR-like C-terminal domain-containing protein n=1 Tax=Tomitella biformata TaxID=630403 RepID=UPI0004653E39|nr:TetR-like C-terminal domain-containing protein [Tomitella biformata]